MELGDEVVEAAAVVEVDDEVADLGGFGAAGESIVVDGEGEGELAEFFFVVGALDGQADAGQQELAGFVELGGDLVEVVEDGGFDGAIGVRLGWLAAGAGQAG